MTENPSAFPAVCLNDPCHPESRLGMTLRDYFAGQALAGYISKGPPLSMVSEPSTYHRAASRSAYAVADAMLSARQETRHGE